MDNPIPIPSTITTATTHPIGTQNTSEQKVGKTKFLSSISLMIPFDGLVFLPECLPDEKRKLQVVLSISIVYRLLFSSLPVLMSVPLIVFLLINVSTLLKEGMTSLAWKNSVIAISLLVLFGIFHVVFLAISAAVGMLAGSFNYKNVWTRDRMVDLPSAKMFVCFLTALASFIPILSLFPEIVSYFALSLMRKRQIQKCKIEPIPTHDEDENPFGDIEMSPEEMLGDVVV